MKAIVLAGGPAGQQAPPIRILPKPLLPIGVVPILEVLLRQLKSTGITDVVLSVGHLSGLLKAFFQDGGQWGLNIQYSYEDKPLGTAGSIGLVDRPEDTFLVIHADVLTNLDFGELIRFHKARNAIGTIAAHRRRVNIDLGILQMDQGCLAGEDLSQLDICSYRAQCHVWKEGCLITGYNEKPKLDYVVSMGINILQPEVLSYIPKDQYIDFPDLVTKLIIAGERVVSFPFEGYWRDLGRPDDYEQATADFGKMRDQFLI